MADTGWKREDIGNEVWFKRKQHGETVEVTADEDGLIVDIEDCRPFEGCGHGIEIPDEVLAALGWTRVKA